jgi:RNA polymerase sigma factor (sigma-70 family)
MLEEPCLSVGAGCKIMRPAGNRETMAKPRNPHEDAVAAQRLEDLFRTHHKAVVAYARRRAAPESVDDVVAETFLVAWRRLDRVPADLPLPWLLAIARNVIATQRRSASRRAALNGRLQASARRRPNAQSAEPSTGIVATTLARLSERDREVLTLIGWDGLSPREAAAVLGELPSTFYVRLHRAKRRFRRLLDEAAERPSDVRIIPVSQEAKEPIP